MEKWHFTRLNTKMQEKEKKSKGIEGKKSLTFCIKQILSILKKYERKILSQILTCDLEDYGFA